MAVAGRTTYAMLPTTDEVAHQVSAGATAGRECPMLFREATLDSKAEWSIVHPDATALTYYVLSPELRDTRCPAAAFSQAPICSGNGCAPCLK